MTGLDHIINFGPAPSGDDHFHLGTEEGKWLFTPNRTHDVNVILDDHCEKELKVEFII